MATGRSWRKQALSIIQPDFTKTGGLFEGMKIANMAETYNIPVAPHGVCSPLGTLAITHVCGVIPNLLVQEFTQYQEKSFTELCDPVKLDAEGFLPVPDAPGIGIGLNEEVGERAAGPGIQDAVTPLLLGQVEDLRHRHPFLPRRGMGQGLLEGPHQSFPFIIFGGNGSRARIIVGHGRDHHHAITRAPDFHAFDPLRMDVVHDLRPYPAGTVKPLIFRDFLGVIDQVQGKTEAAAHFDILS